MRKHVAPTFLALTILAAFLSFGPCARAGDGAAPSYPDWAAAVVPAYPHARVWSSPIAARVQSKMYGLATTDLMPTVVAWYKARVQRLMVGKRGRKYLVYKERRSKNPDLREYLR